MDKFDELLDKLRGLNILQEESSWEDNIPNDIWEEYFEDNFEEVKSGLNPSKHRWYEVSTTVIKIYGRLLGITYVSNLFSETMEYEDCYEQLTFKEMKEVKTVSYKEK